MKEYALLFAGCHLIVAMALGILLSQFGSGRHSGVGTAVIYGSAVLVGSVFARRRKRLFTDPEMWRLIGLCLAYLMAFEMFGLWGNADQVSKLSPAAWAGVLAFTIGVNLLTLWVAFRFVVRWTMRQELERMDKADTAPPPEGHT